jgi:hypothetical protein
MVCTFFDFVLVNDDEIRKWCVHALVDEERRVEATVGVGRRPGFLHRVTTMLSNY